MAASRKEESINGGFDVTRRRRRRRRGRGETLEDKIIKVRCIHIYLPSDVCVAETTSWS